MINFILLLFVICFELLSIFIGKMENIRGIISILYFSSNIIIPLVIIIYFLMRNKYNDKAFLLWMLLIPMIAFAPFLFLYAIPFLFNKTWINPYVTAWAFFSIPIGYTYLILSKRLLDLGIILNRLIYYTSLTFIPSLLIALVLIWFIPVFTYINLIQFFSIIIFFNTTFLMMKEHVDYYFRDSIFQDKNNVAQGVEKLIRDLKNIMTLPSLINYLTREINGNYITLNATIIKYNTVTKHLEKEYLIGKENFDDIPLVQFAKKDNELLIENKKNLGFFLSKQLDTIHYLCLKKSKKNMRFHVREKTELLVFISYIRLAYENILINQQYVDQLLEVNEKASNSQSRFLFHIAEAERRKLAEEIHNTILQDQLYIYRKLDNLKKNDHSELITIKNELKQILNKTREMCSEMKPNNIVDKGLVDSIHELLHQLQNRADFHLEYEIEISREGFGDYGKTIMIYRIIEEMLNNAIKHSNAKRVSINVWEADQNIYLDYLDDGQGFNQEEALHTEQIGLKSIIERIKSMNGIIEFSTKVPKNVQIYITIPKVR